jgi:hypothetical protein
VFPTDVAFDTMLFRSQVASASFDTLVDDQARIRDMLVEAYGTPKGKRALARRGSGESG